MINQTHKRTLAKTVIYRVLSVIAIIILALSFGASDAIAGTLGLGAVVLGSISYYIHDRVWLKFGLLAQTNNELPMRSLIKSITYRIIVLVLAFGMARLFLTSNNGTAALFTVLQMIINFVLYYIVERVNNYLTRKSNGISSSQPHLSTDL
jgi:uncharacterized membrane protein